MAAPPCSRGTRRRGRRTSRGLRRAVRCAPAGRTGSCMARYAALSSSLPPLTSTDLYEFRFLTDAQISPDGARLADAVKADNDPRDGYRGGIWLIPFDESESASQITSGVGQDSSPRWSPDGRNLAFLSDRGEPAKGKKRAPRNVYVQAQAGAEARPRTTFAGDCAGLV